MKVVSYHLYSKYVVAEFDSCFPLLVTHRSAAKEKDEIKKVRRNYKGSLFCFMITIRNGLEKYQQMKNLARLYQTIGTTRKIMASFGRQKV